MCPARVRREQELVFQQTVCTARSLVTQRGSASTATLAGLSLGSAPPEDTKPSRARAPSLQHIQGTAELPG